MQKETRALLEKANESLNEAYKNVRIAISDLRDDKGMQIKIQPILGDIDKAKQEIEKLLYPAVSDVEIFAIIDGDGKIVGRYSEANHI